MKIRKNTQLSLINQKRAGRPTTVDIGIRHICRQRISKPTALHLTIKVRENKADMHKTIMKSEFLKRLQSELRGILDLNRVYYLDTSYLWG